MNTKKIWLIAMFFGLVASGLLYFIITSEPPAKTEQASSVIKEKESPKNEHKVSAAEVEEESTDNKLIPVSKGNRAMTIAVNDVQGVAGFIKPDAFVDIVAVMTAPEESKEEGQHDSATLLMQNIKVLSVGHSADDPETMKRYQMVTVEVTPKQGLTLGFSSRYQLYLMLREEGDSAVVTDKTHIHEDELHEGVFK